MAIRAVTGALIPQLEDFTPLIHHAEDREVLKEEDILPEKEMEIEEPKNLPKEADKKEDKEEEEQKPAGIELSPKKDLEEVLKEEAKDVGIDPDLIPGLFSLAAGTGGPGQVPTQTTWENWSYSPFDPEHHIYVTSGFGAQDTAARRGGSHIGVDLRAREGTPLTSPFENATVRGRGYSDDFGNFIILEHPSDRSLHRYGHLQSLEGVPEIGTRLERGSSLGNVGRSGITTGAHLHYDIRRPRGEGWESVDPTTWSSQPQRGER